MITLKLAGYQRGEKTALLAGLEKLQNAICCESYECETCPSKYLCNDLTKAKIFLQKELMSNENS